MVPVLFVLLPGVVLLDVAGPAEAFRIAAKLAPDSFSLAFCGPQAQVDSAVGLRLSGLAPLPAQVDPRTLVVLAGVTGAYEPLAGDSAVVTQWLAQRQPQDGFRLMCVCSGALVAAAAGLLRGRECTSHHTCLPLLAQHEPTARVCDNRIFVQDGDIYTSAGITAGIDLALHLIAQEGGPRLACDVARDMVVYLRRAGNDAALSPWLTHRNHLHPGVHRVQDAISRDPTAPWSAQRMAALAHASPRHLARLFGEHAGCRPMEYLQRVRVALARELLRETGLNLERVAEKAGFGSAHHLRRVWRKFEEASPGHLRAVL